MKAIHGWGRQVVVAVALLFMTTTAWSAHSGYHKVVDGGGDCAGRDGARPSARAPGKRDAWWRCSTTSVPLESMPLGLQYLTEVSPLRHYMEAVLGLFLKGVGLDVLWPQFTAMRAISAVLLALSVWRFRRYLG